MQKLCEDIKIAQKKLGKENSQKLFQRIAEIRAADNLAILRMLPYARCHPLAHNRKGQYAADLIHPKRLIFLPVFDGDLEEKLITEVVIIEVIDYH